jgi:hypothetical protein
MELPPNLSTERTEQGSMELTRISRPSGPNKSRWSSPESLDRADRAGVDGAPTDLSIERTAQGSMELPTDLSIERTAQGSMELPTDLSIERTAQGVSRSTLIGRRWICLSWRPWRLGGQNPALRGPLPTTEMVLPSLRDPLGT